MTRHQPAQVGDPTPGYVDLLLERARAGRLVICAGAGLSRADDTALPSGRDLAVMLSRRLTETIAGYQVPGDESDLLRVADSGLGATGNLGALQLVVRDLVPFATAPANFGHRALALLLLEGAVSRLLLWNWDDCVERSSPPGERLQVALTQDDTRQLAPPYIAKVHGCVSRTNSMLITSDQLSDPPVWSDAATEQALREATTVFLGVGDIADYTKHRLTALAAAVEQPSVWVVSPSIIDAWEGSQWSQVLPALSESQRIAATADAFLDAIARGWARQALYAAEDLTGGLEDAARTGAMKTIAAIRQVDAVHLITWLRECAFRPVPGHSMVLSPEATQGLLAMGVLAGSTDADVRLYRGGAFQAGDTAMLVLTVTGNARAADVVREARTRVRREAELGRDLGVQSVLVSGGVIGQLYSAEATTDVFDPLSDPLDILIGPEAAEPTYLFALAVLNGETT